MLLKLIMGFLFTSRFLIADAQVDSNSVFLASKGTWDYPLSNRYEPSKTAICNYIYSLNATFYASLPESIKAIMPGTVVGKVTIDSSCLVITKFGDYFLAYSNLCSSPLKKGDLVRKGQIIGQPDKSLLITGKFSVDIHVWKEDEMNASDWFRKNCLNESSSIF